MECEWDDAKNEKNLKKHGIDFRFVQELFTGVFISKVDNRKDYGEKRLLALGTLGNFILLVVYTIRGDKIRIISARRANEEERRVYYGYITRGTIEDPWSDERL
ncbi:BrnT family toxin [Pleurocapsales cyanobacterium LEGE 06147]|nr:BrnT family toxin [Pleurocapsales cyanobacterium LEGE 06147]